MAYRPVRRYEPVATYGVPATPERTSPPRTVRQSLDQAQQDLEMNSQAEGRSPEELLHGSYTSPQQPEPHSTGTYANFPWPSNHSDLSQVPSTYSVDEGVNSQNGPERVQPTYPVQTSSTISSPQRVASSHQRNDAGSKEAWRQRQQPQQQPDLSRFRTRKIKLAMGSVLSADYPVPSAIQASIPKKSRNGPEQTSGEFTHLRYTAATCDPNDFTFRNGYNLRPAIYNRHTELVVSITVFNEDKVLLGRTLHAVMENVRDIVNLKKSHFWNKSGPAWQKIVVCILIDGIQACDKAILDLLATVGVYQDGLLKKEVDGKETQAHIFEYTTQLSVTSDQRLIRPHDDSRSTLPPVQLILCLKPNNSQKINSHRWLFTAFGRILNPEIVICLDVGTKPYQNSLLAMWEAFYNDKDLGGACGEVRCLLGKSWQGLLNPLTAAQNFEYKIAYQLDRALEAATGYITVLPGAFSAFRYRAIMGRPLEQYFYGDQTLDKALGKKGIGGMNLLKKNMYLADDRILCFETVMKSGAKWHLGYVKAAKAETDNPDDMAGFISQRRRWLNGAFAANIYSVLHFTRFWRSGHSFPRQALFHVQFIYNIVSFLLSWFSLAGFLLTLFVVNEISGDPPPGTQASGFPFGKATPIFNAILQLIYICTIVVQFILALGTRPRAARWSYFISFFIFGIVQIYFLMNVIYLFKRVGDIRFQHSNQGAKNFEYINVYYSDIGDLTVIISGVASFGVYIAAGFLHLDPWHLFTSYAQYLFVVSSYTNILSVYAFSNFNDHSWGHKGTYPEPLVTTSAVSKSTSNRQVIVEEPEYSQADIDCRFEATVKRALAPHVPPHRTKDLSLEDDAKMFRIRLVGVYIFSNFFLCIFVLNDSFKHLHWLGDSYWHKIWFFRIWLWANAGCLYFRFIGSCVDLGKKALCCCFSRR